MDFENEKWIENVLSSMKGSSRAKPSTDLFSKIETALDQKTAQLVSLSHLRFAGIAACFLLIINSITIYSNIQDANAAMNGQLVENIHQSQYNTNYQIYE